MFILVLIFLVIYVGELFCVYCLAIFIFMFQGLGSCIWDIQGFIIGQGLVYPVFCPKELFFLADKFGCLNMHLVRLHAIPLGHIGASLSCSNLHGDPVRSSKLHLPKFEKKWQYCFLSCLFMESPNPNHYNVSDLILCARWKNLWPSWCKVFLISASQLTTHEWRG